MANIVIGSACNEHCPYCFTVDGRPAGGPAFLSSAAFDERLDFLARSAIDEARLLGGEPTLHPRFPQLVERALAAGRRVVVFTNGLVPDAALACLEAAPAGRCTVLVNLSSIADDDDEGRERRRAVLCRLGSKALPGWTIDRVDFRVDPVLALVAGTGCQPSIRLGIAHPCLSGVNRFIHPGQYRAVAIRIVALASSAAGMGFALDLDCGFVRCVFADSELEALRLAGARLAWRCSPIVDVDLDGSAIPCFPLARLIRVPVGGDMTASTLLQAFAAALQPYRQTGVFPECAACGLRLAGECSGGCLAAAIRRFRRAPVTVAVPAAPAPGQEVVA